MSWGRHSYSYATDIMKRSRAGLGNIQFLCSDIPENMFYASTAEIFKPNDFYGNAEQLKRFLSIPSTYPLKASIQHGAQFDPVYWDVELMQKFDVALVWGDYVYNLFKKHTEKKVFAIGSPFFYVQSILSQEDIFYERKRLGKNILVFPTHSSHHVYSTFDIKLWLQRISELKRDFDSIRICIYWKNYLLGEHRPYLDAGYECVTAGHMFDCNFLPRLRSLLEISDATLSNTLSTHIGYSIFLNRPHVLLQQEVIYKSDLVNAQLFTDPSLWEDPDIQHLLYIFSRREFSITHEQRHGLEPYFGFNHIKSKEKLWGIFALAENIHTRIKDKK